MMKAMIGGKRIWYSLRRRVHKASTWVRSSWWWLALVVPIVGTGALLMVVIAGLPTDVAAVVACGIAFSFWTVAVLVAGVVIGASLTWQRQQQIPPAVPIVQPQPPDDAAMPDIQSPDFYANLAEKFAAGHEDAIPGQTADEEEEVPPPVTGFQHPR